MTGWDLQVSIGPAESILPTFDPERCKPLEISHFGLLSRDGRYEHDNGVLAEVLAHSYVHRKM